MAAPAVRRADFLMALAYATDLATGHSRDFALRSCVLAMRFAEVAGLDQDTRRSVYHQALLRYIGCNADTHLLAAAWGDEITLRRELHHIDMGNRAEFVEIFVRAITRKFAGASPEELAEAVERGLAEGPQVNIPILSGHCEVAQRIAERIGLPEEIRENLGQIYERWDGKGLPRGLSGNAVKFPVRLVTLAQDAIALNDHHGFETMKAMIAKRAGGGYEPELVDLFLTHAEKLLAGLDGPVDRETILALEPAPHAMLDEEACEEAYLAIADMIDMRMPFTFGHSRAVASLADAAAKQMGLPASDIRDVRWAAYTHDIGELAVPVSTWMRAGALTERETDAAQLHPYHGERALASLGRRRQGGCGAGAAPSRAPRRQRLSSQFARPRSLARRPHPCRRRSLPDRARGKAPPARIERRGRGREAARARSGKESSAPTRSRRFSPAPANPRAGRRPSGWRA